MAHSSPSRTVLLLHVCPLRALASIRRRGLDPARSQGAAAVVWLCAPRRRRWAITHVWARHHLTALNPAIVLRVRVRRAWLVRRARGLWNCSRLIPPAALVSVSLPAFADQAG